MAKIIRTRKLHWCQHWGFRELWDLASEAIVAKVPALPKVTEISCYHCLEDNSTSKIIDSSTINHTIPLGSSAQ